jgi:hypothetical protein
MIKYFSKKLIYSQIRQNYIITSSNNVFRKIIINKNLCKSQIGFSLYNLNEKISIIEEKIKNNNEFIEEINNILEEDDELEKRGK